MYVSQIPLPVQTGQVKKVEWVADGHGRYVEIWCLELAWRTSTSLHDMSSVGRCGASPDKIKMHSQSCCEVHLDSAESKSIEVRAGKESALV